MTMRPWRHSVMKSFRVFLFCAASLSLLSGCSFIGSSQPSLTAATGEAWYTKTRYFFIFPYSQEIYYCDGKADVCKEAVMR